MINKDEAIKLIKEIQQTGIDTSSVDIPKGTIASKLWGKNDRFCLGIEYGAIFILMKIFNLSKNDL
jgi:hypothetical protein